jgi:hypothetical protein
MGGVVASSDGKLAAVGDAVVAPAASAAPSQCTPVASASAGGASDPAATPAHRSLQGALALFFSPQARGDLSASQAAGATGSPLPRRVSARGLLTSPLSRTRSRARLPPAEAAALLARLSIPALFAQKALCVLTRSPHAGFYRALLTHMYAAVAAVAPVPAAADAASGDGGTLRTWLPVAAPAEQLASRSLAGVTLPLPLAAYAQYVLSRRVPPPRPSYTLRLNLIPPAAAPASPGLRDHFAHPATLSRADARCLPDCGGDFAALLHCLSPANVVTAVHLLLLEQKVVMHCSRGAVLAPVAEALCALLFPLAWQFAYIPMCPASLLVRPLHCAVACRLAAHAVLLFGLR